VELVESPWSRRLLPVTLGSAEGVFVVDAESSAPQLTISINRAKEVTIFMAQKLSQRRFKENRYVFDATVKNL
jgi:hypothetical protein